MTLPGRYVQASTVTVVLTRQADHYLGSALIASPGVRASYDQQRHRGIGHHAALRQLGNRLVGILHGCLKTGTAYNETTAWQHRQQHDPTVAA